MQKSTPPFINRWRIHISSLTSSVIRESFKHIGTSLHLLNKSFDSNPFAYIIKLLSPSYTPHFMAVECTAAAAAGGGSPANLFDEWIEVLHSRSLRQITGCWLSECCRASKSQIELDQEFSILRMKFWNESVSSNVRTKEIIFLLAE